MRDTRLNQAVMRDVLGHLGLINDVDFRVSPYADLAGVSPMGSIVNFYGIKTVHIVANHADRIEAEAAALGVEGIHVNVRYPFGERPDVPMVEMSDFGTKVRHTPRFRKADEPGRSALLMDVAREFARGARVLAVDDYGITSRAVVNGLSLELVAELDREDADRAPTWRARVGITWDETLRNASSTNRRSQLFTDQAVKVDQAFRSADATSVFVGARFERDGVSFSGGQPRRYPVSAVVVAASFEADFVTFEVRDRCHPPTRSPKQFSMQLDDFRTAWVL